MRDSDWKEVAKELPEPEEVASAPGLDQVLAEATKILTTRRWQVREEPFRGFGSPPGKF